MSIYYSDRLDIKPGKTYKSGKCHRCGGPFDITRQAKIFCSTSCKSNHFNEMKQQLALKNELKIKQLEDEILALQARIKVLESELENK